MKVSGSLRKQGNIWRQRFQTSSGVEVRVAAPPNRETTTKIAIAQISKDTYLRTILSSSSNGKLEKFVEGAVSAVLGSGEKPIDAFFFPETPTFIRDSELELIMVADKRKKHKILRTGEEIEVEGRSIAGKLELSLGLSHMTLVTLPEVDWISEINYGVYSPNQDGSKLFVKGYPEDRLFKMGGGMWGLVICDEAVSFLLKSYQSKFLTDEVKGVFYPSAACQFLQRKFLRMLLKDLNKSKALINISLIGDGMAGRSAVFHPESISGDACLVRLPFQEIVAVFDV